MNYIWMILTNMVLGLSVFTNDKLMKMSYNVFKVKLRNKPIRRNIHLIFNESS